MEIQTVTVVLVVINILVGTITPIIKCITRIKRSKCMGAEIELTASASQDKYSKNERSEKNEEV